MLHPVPPDQDGRKVEMSPLLAENGMAPLDSYHHSDPPPPRTAPARDAEKAKSVAEPPPPQAKKVQEGPAEALDGLAAVEYEEAEILLRCNAQDVEYFFRRKGVPSIGKALAMNGVSGSSIHMLSPHDIESKLNLNLGQQLALKNFIRQMQGISKNSRRVEKIWAGEEASDIEEEVWKPGCCKCAWCFCYCLCCCCRQSVAKKKKPPSAKLKKACYTLTSSELSIETWSWVDKNLVEQEVVLSRTPNCGCGSCCGYSLEPTPQQCTTTNNIDLSCVEDVDNRKFTAKTVEKKPSCTEFCCGYTETQVTPAATVNVTYVDRGNIEGARRVQAEFRVKPEVMHDVTRKIIAEKDAALEAMATRTGNYESFSMNNDVM